MSNTPVTCAFCGAPLSTRRSRYGRIPGVLETGSFTHRVVNYLHDNPERELTGEDISLMFDGAKVNPRDVGKRLSTALRHGYIESAISARGKRVFRKPGAVK